MSPLFRRKVRLVESCLATAVLLLSFAVAGCGEGPTEHRNREYPGGPQAVVIPPGECTDDPCFQPDQDRCVVKDVDLYPANASVVQGQNAEFQASAYGRTLYGNDPCALTGLVSFTWSVADQNVAKVGRTYTGGGQGPGFAEIYGNSPGASQVTVSVTMAGDVSAPVVVESGTLTVLAPTATPTVGSVTGPSTVTTAGWYSFSTFASGGNGSSYTYQWEKSTDGGATWTVIHSHSGGTTVSTNIFVNGGDYFQLRVRAKSGTSAWSPPSAALQVDARGAPPVDPLTAAILGPSEIPPNKVCSWVGSAAGGIQPYTYDWVAVGTGILNDGSSGNTYSLSATHGAIEITMSVDDAYAGHVVVTKSVWVNMNLTSCP